MADNVVPLQRHSVGEILKEVTELGPTARGMCLVVFRKDGGGHFRLSGFMSKGDLFTLCGLLDWIKADLLNDIK